MSISHIVLGIMKIYYRWNSIQFNDFTARNIPLNDVRPEKKDLVQGNKGQLVGLV